MIANKTANILSCSDKDSYVIDSCLPAHQGANEVVLYDLVGKKIVEFFGVLEEKLEVDMSGFESGVYLVRIRNDEGIGED